MSETTTWAFPDTLQPRPEQVGFDLEAALRSVVALRVAVPEDAMTASVLGTERVGNGVVIRADGLLVTIGYLITEAESIWITTQEGTVVPGHALAYDQVTGFGLVQPLGRVNLPAIECGSSAATGLGDAVIVIGHGGLAHSLNARVIGDRKS